MIAEMQEAIVCLFSNGIAVAMIAARPTNQLSVFEIHMHLPTTSFPFVKPGLAITAAQVRHHYVVAALPCTLAYLTGVRYAISSYLHQPPRPHRWFVHLKTSVLYHKTTVSNAKTTTSIHYAALQTLSLLENDWSVMVNGID